MEKKDMGKKLENIPHILGEYNNFYPNNNSEVKEFIQNFKELHITRKIIMEEYNNIKETSFNVFDDLSINNRFDEIEHSKIIKKIFDNKNVVIGNYQHLSLFLQLIKEKYNIEINDFDIKYIVEKEKKSKNLGSIDIIIYEKKDGGNCIIIENKITQKAIDQDNQLSRYFKIAKEEMNKNVAAIVYLPFYFQNPSERNYTGVYKKYKEIIKPVLCVIPAIDPVNKIDFVHGFLDKCVALAKNNNKHTTAVCIEQYSNFLKSKAEKGKITMNNDKQFLEKLLLNEKSIGITEDIVEVWSRKESIIYEELKRKLKDHSYYDDDLAFLKEFNSNKDIFTFFGLGKNTIEIGFGHKKSKFNKESMDALESIFKDDDLKPFISFLEKGTQWVYGTYNIGKLTGKYNDMFSQVKNVLDDLEKKAVKVLK